MNCIIILMFLNTEIKKNMMIAENFQNLLFLLILYFFYTAELLNFYNNNNEKFNASVFINDIILLTYEFSMKVNCCMLI